MNINEENDQSLLRLKDLSIQWEWATYSIYITSAHLQMSAEMWTTRREEQGPNHPVQPAGEWEEGHCWVFEICPAGKRGGGGWADRAPGEATTGSPRGQRGPGDAAQSTHARTSTSGYWTHQRKWESWWVVSLSLPAYLQFKFSRALFPSIHCDLS